MDGRRSLGSLDGVRRIHLIAVGGVGMAALAGMLRQRGFELTGSDESLYPPMSDVVGRLGIRVYEGYRAENLDSRPDLVVVGNKVSRDNPEVETLLGSGIPYLSLPEALARFFIAGRRSVVVAGTHGKTTSTAMMAWVLECAGRDPSFLVGGVSLDFGANFKLGKGGDFVVEGDEYDSAFFDKGPKFLHYRPDALLLTAIEFDHADIYRDLPAVKDAFRRLLELVPQGAPLVVAADFPHAVDVAVASGRPTTTFGLAADAEWLASDAHDTGEQSVFTVRRRGAAEGVVRLRLPGAINALNALGVYAMARELGLRHPEIADGLASFAGVARRQELVGEFGGIVLVDDFAHHPTAVAGTIAALRSRYPGRRLWALFEPRSNTTRRGVFQDDYVQALRGADRVVLGEVFVKKSDAVAASEMFSPERLVWELRRLGVAAWCLPTSERIAALVAESANRGDVVVLMSNGDFQGLRGLLERRLRSRGSAAAEEGSAT